MDCRCGPGPKASGNNPDLSKRVGSIFDREVAGSTRQQHEIAEHAASCWRRKHGISDARPAVWRQLDERKPTGSRVWVPSLPLLQAQRADPDMKRAATPHTLPLGRGLANHQTDQGKSGQANPLTSTPLIGVGSPTQPQFEYLNSERVINTPRRHVRQSTCGTPRSNESCWNITERGNTRAWRGLRIGMLSSTLLYNGSPRVIENYSSTQNDQNFNSLSGNHGWQCSRNQSNQRFDKPPRKNMQLLEMFDLGHSASQIRQAAAVKIQRMLRAATGKEFLQREQLKGRLVTVPPETRLEIRDRVQKVFTSELPSYTFEAWRFETPWDPFVIGSKFSVSQHPTVKDKMHPFVRLGKQFDDSHLPGSNDRHEPLGSHRQWVNRMYRERSKAVLADAMKAAWD